MSMKKQLVFYKGGRLRFVGHLDMMRTMHRAMVRAGIPLAYSQGFNPHPHMSFSSPLALGCVGDKEIMEIRLEKEMTDQAIFEQLNNQLPEGLHVHAVRELEDNAPPIMAQVRFNEYRIVFPEDLNARAALEAMTEGGAIMVTKYGKVHGQKRLIQVDVKPLMKEITWENDHTLVLLAAGGSETNLKPELLLEKMYQQMGCPERQHEERTTRTRIFGADGNGELIDFSDYSTWTVKDEV